MGAALGNLIVISAPSGAGKTSLVRALIERVDGVQVSVSHTTRPQRANEVHGEDYFFVDDAEFDAMIRAGDFVEHAEVFGNFYGTSRAALDEALNAGIDVVLEIDWQGGRAVRAAYDDALSIFVLPPSQEALRQRLVGRGLDDDAVIEQRMAAAVGEMSHYDEYAYLVVNDEFSAALDEICAIVIANRAKTANRGRNIANQLARLIAS